jgi:hypothetical protein|tara:strand:+ start:268 stop:417 length:150 start_codon:yes stop_codon:yes gene_type:complete
MIILKLLLGLGTKEDFDPTPMNIFITGLILGASFLGTVSLLIYVVLSII